MWTRPDPRSPGSARSRWSQQGTGQCLPWSGSSACHSPPCTQPPHLPTQEAGSKGTWTGTKVHRHGEARGRDGPGLAGVVASRARSTACLVRPGVCGRWPPAIKTDCESRAVDHRGHRRQGSTQAGRGGCRASRWTTRPGPVIGSFGLCADFERLWDRGGDEGPNESKVPVGVLGRPGDPRVLEGASIMHKKMLGCLAALLLMVASVTSLGGTAGQAVGAVVSAAPTSPTDETKVPHYFGP